MSLPNVAPAEMRILRYVLDHHPISVREVAEHVARAEGLTRTTVLNVMERLRRKGYLTRAPQDGIFQYAPSTPKREMQRDLVRRFVDEALGGSVEPFMAYLTHDAMVGEAELAELRQFVEELDIRRGAAGDAPRTPLVPRREGDAG